MAMLFSFFSSNKLHRAQTKSLVHTSAHIHHFTTIYNLERQYRFNHNMHSMANVHSLTLMYFH